MNCQELRDLIPDYLTKRLSEENVRVFQAHLSQCESCRSELEQMESAWTALGKLPDAEPSPQLRSRFYTMLEEEKRLLRQVESISWLQRIDSWINSWWPRRPVTQLAAVAVFLVVGLVAGVGLKAGMAGNGEISQLRNEVQQMHQMVSLSLLNQNASSERLQGVNWATNVSEPSDVLLSSLTNTLESDPNVNVRLAVVDALMIFRDKPGVADVVSRALSQEDSPMVQIALIDLLIAIQEKEALEALRKFIELKNVDPTVKKHAHDRMSFVM